MIHEREFHDVRSRYRFNSREGKISEEQ